MKYLQTIIGLIIVVILLGTDLILVSRLRNSRQEILIRDSIINDQGVSSHKLDYVGSNLMRSYQFSGMKLENMKIIDTAGNAVTVKEMVRKAPVLVLRYHEGNCQECVVFGLSKMNSFSKGKKIQSVVLPRYNEMYPFKMSNQKLNSHSLPFYNCQEDFLLDNQNTPYFFILDTDLNVNAIFIPDKVYPKVTDQYLETIYDRFFTN